MVVVGGGISGLAAAYFLHTEPVRVTVLEGSPRLGGKLSVSDVAGIGVDEGAEALLARRPEGTDLVRAVGLGGDLVTPGTTSSAVWTRGALRPLPRRQFLGVPADSDELAHTGLLSASGLARARREADLPPATRNGDVSVAAYIGGAFGGELVDRLVDPLLGGVYAGRSSELSFEATMGPLAAASRGRRLSAAVASLLPPSAGAGAPRSGTAPGGGGADGPAPVADPGPPPVFTTLTGGLGGLPAAVAAAAGATATTRSTVRELWRTPSGWRLVVGSAAHPRLVDADAVVLAVPARPAARLLAGVPSAAAAATALDGIDYASMAIVALAYPRSAFPPAAGSSSGYLVPAVDGHPVKAVTYSTVKWPHLRTDRPPVEVVRCSVGRIGEERLLQREDADLAALAAADLAEATGVSGPPVGIRVSRWGGALPQYTVGHLDRVAAVRAAVAGQPGLAVCGAAYDGVGVPACVATAREAARQVAGYLANRPRPTR